MGIDSIGGSSPRPPQKNPTPSKSAEFFFGSDAHDNLPLLDEFISQANCKKPDLVLSGGDLENERGIDPKLASELSKLKEPFAAVPGNHDFKGKEIGGTEVVLGKESHSFDYNGVHFLLLDDSEQSLSEESFQSIEKDLSANQGKPMVVAMHVPPVWEASGFSKELHKLVPKNFANATIGDPDQVQRFTSLMSQYGVGLVLSGHTHEPADLTIGGVRYVTAGAVGGKLLSPGLAHEYLDIQVQDGKFTVKHVQLDKPIGIKQAVAQDATYLFHKRAAIGDYLKKLVKLPFLH